MNKVILMGRLTLDPEVRYSGGDNATAVTILWQRTEDSKEIMNHRQTLLTV